MKAKRKRKTQPTPASRGNDYANSITTRDNGHTWFIARRAFIDGYLAGLKAKGKSK